MLTVTTCPLELRGIANKTTSNGRTYYVLNCESNDGTPHAMYCPSADALPAGLKKGDMVTMLCDVRTYDRSERLIVKSVRLAPAK